MEPASMTRLKTLKPRLAPAAAPGGWKPDAVRGTRQARGYGREWEKLRLEILARDHGLCRPCSAVGRTTPASQVDHVVPKAHAVVLGWSAREIDHPDNLQAICPECHRAKTASEAAGPGAGQISARPKT